MTSARRGILLIVPATVWLLLFAVAPVVLLVVMSFWTSSIFGTTVDFTLDNYRVILDDPIYFKVGGRKIDQLSGGQRQRVAMARALVNDPEVLLLDEPLGALDLRLRLQMQEELRRLHKQIGATFIFVTHDQSEAISMSDRIAVMSRGRIQQVGSPREIYERPVNRFVAEFMGHSNFYEGTVVRKAADGVGEVDIHGRMFPCRIPTAFDVGAQVFVALRYERVEVQPLGDLCAGLEGTLVDETYLGPTLQRTVDLGPLGRMIADSANNGREAPLGVGARVCVRWTIDSPTVLSSAQEAPRIA